MTTLTIRKLRGDNADGLVVMRSTLDHLDVVDPGQLWIYVSEGHWADITS